EAADHALALVQRYPSDPRLLNFIGGVLLELGRPEQGISYLRQAVAIAPDNIDATYNLGLSAAALGDFETAAEAYRRTLAIDPRHGPAINNLCHILGKLERFDPAEIRAVFPAAHRKFFQRNPAFAVAAADCLSLGEWCAARDIPLHELD